MFSGSLVMLTSHGVEEGSKEGRREEEKKTEREKEKAKAKEEEDSAHQGKEKAEEKERAKAVHNFKTETYTHSLARRCVMSVCDRGHARVVSTTRIMLESTTSVNDTRLLSDHNIAA